MLVLPVLALLAFLTAAIGQESTLEFSCATFDAFMSEADLVARYGRESVTNGQVFGAGEGPRPGTILFAEQDDARVEICLA